MLDKRQIVLAVAITAACGDDGDAAGLDFGGLGSIGTGDPHPGDTGDDDVGKGGDDSGSEGGAGEGIASESEGGLKWDLGIADDGGGETGPQECPIPALMIVLDRSFSMAEDATGTKAPNIGSTKWAHAVGAIEGFVGAYQHTIDFGFAMFPSPADNQYCDHVDEVLDGAHVDGFLCSATTEVAPAAGTAQAIIDRIDPADTRLCKGTPIDAALQAAGAVLPAGGGANIVLVSDGKEKCNGNPVARAQALAAGGVQTWVIGFGNLPSGSVSHQSLNQIACAGRTASNFMTSCYDDGAGNWSAVDPAGAALYVPAEDGQALADALVEQIAGNICCGSACPPG